MQRAATRSTRSPLVGAYSPPARNMASRARSGSAIGEEPDGSSGQSRTVDNDIPPGDPPAPGDGIAPAGARDVARLQDELPEPPGPATQGRPPNGSDPGDNGSGGGDRPGSRPGNSGSTRDGSVPLDLGIAYTDSDFRRKMHLIQCAKHHSKMKESLHLKGDSNWNVWEHSMCEILGLLELPTSFEEAKIALARMTQGERIVVNLAIKANLGSTPQALVYALKDPVQTLTALEKNFKPQGQATRDQVFLKWLSLEYTTGPLADFNVKVQELHREMTAMEIVVEPRDLLSSYLHALEKNKLTQPWAQRFRGMWRLDPKLTLQEAMTDASDELRSSQHASRKETKSGSSSGSSGQKSRDKDSGKGKGKSTNNTNASTMPSSSGSKKKKGKGKGSGTPSQSSDSSNSGNADSKKQKKDKEKKQQDQQSKDDEVVNMATFVTVDIPTPDEDFLGLSDEPPMLTSLAASQPAAIKSQWLYDTGSGVHICNDRTLFLTLDESSHLRPLKTGGGLVYPAGSGSVCLECWTGKQYQKAVLHNTLYCPDFFTNIFSGLVHYKKGGCIQGNDIISPSGKVLAILNPSKTGFYLRIRGAASPSSACIQQLYCCAVETQSNLVSPESMERVAMHWHRLLGHPGLELLKKTSLQVAGMPNFTGLTQLQCDDCDRGKFIRQQSKGPAAPIAQALQVIVGDMVRISPIPSRKKKYMLLLTDRCTRYRWIEFSSSPQFESQIRNRFRFFHTQYGRYPARFHYDGGTEVSPEKLGAWLRKKGIVFTTTAPDTPEQNAISERGIRTLCTRLRVVMLSILIARNYWDIVVIGVVDLINKTCNTLQDQTPHQLFFDQVYPDSAPHVPSFKDVHPIGCKVLVHAPKAKSNKLEPPCKQGYLLMSEAPHVHWVYLPKRSGGPKAVKSAHVKFYDNTVPEPGSAREGEDPLDFEFFDPQPSQEHGEVPEPPADQQVSEPPEDQQVSESSENQQASESSDDQQDLDAQASEDQLDQSSDQESEPEQSVSPPSRQARRRSERVAQRQAAKAAKAAAKPSDSITRAPRRVTIDIPLQTTSARDRLKYRALCIDLYKDILATVAAISQPTQPTPLSPEPRTFKQALKSSEKEHWLKACFTEITQVLERGCFKFIPRHRSPRVPLTCRWVLKRKLNPDGTVKKYKARLVVRGFQQVEGLDFNQTFASSTTPPTWRTLLALAAVYDWEIEQIDFIGAFLYSDLEEDIYIEVVDGLDEFFRNHPALAQKIGWVPGEDQVILLRKALYGLKQGPRQWQAKVRNILKDFGFAPLISDSAVYWNPRIAIFAVSYVDDFLLIGPQLEEIQKFKRHISETYEIQDLGAAEYFLGIQIVRDRPRRRLWLHQQAYIDKMLEQFGLTEAKDAPIPLSPGVPSSRPEGQVLPKPRLVEYQRHIGSLMYSMVQTRPDIAFSVSFLARAMHNPTGTHLHWVRTLLRYLKGTRDLGIMYDGLAVEDKQNPVSGSSDASFADCIETSKSTSGYVFTIAGGPASWRSKRQPLASLSTLESEYNGLTIATKEAAWFQNFFKEIGMGLTKPIQLLCDNKGGISTAYDPAHHQRTKHTLLRFAYVRQEVQTGTISIQYVPTAEMPADGLTKALPRDKFEKFRLGLGLVPVPTTATGSH